MFYIGFSKLSEFQAALEPERDLYLAPLSIVKSREPISTCTVSMVASQIKGDHMIYCCRRIMSADMRGHHDAPDL